MQAVLNIIAPVFAIIALGYAAVRFNLINREQTAGLGTFVIRIGMPALIFHALTARGLGATINNAYLLAYIVAAVLGFALGWFGTYKFTGNRAFAALNGMAFGMPNSGFIGYPLLAMVLGNEEAGGYFAMNVLVEMILVLPALFILLDLATGKNSNITTTLKRIIFNLLKNPMMLALLAGLLVSTSGIPMPIFIQKTTSLLAAATSPLALFVIGAGLYGLAFQSSNRHLLAIAAIRTTFFPLLVSGSLWLFGADKQTLFIGTLMSCAPIPTTYAIFAREHNLGAQTAAIALASTLLSLLPITLVLVLWH
ncbi:MAG: AEC family transporter [Alysiella sp.]|uniref:AEC family transporter n=1 Tax=Alysiella sp. TaxID=1872483 RepID=UPI0026DAA515|nr:AEC family transporter [Alysiella sp.]MDO4433070.1 AEC family transporter [Alysiella sp.]